MTVHSTMPGVTTERNRANRTAWITRRMLAGIETALTRDGHRWEEQARCRFAWPELFYPPHYTPEHMRRARAYCDECPVRLECLSAGMDEEHGVWGGTSPTEREGIRE